MSRTTIPQGILLVSLFALLSTRSPCSAPTEMDGWNRIRLKGESSQALAIDAVTPPANVTITGPLTGFINTAYTFTATVNPVTSTTPITYIWAATEQSDIAKEKDSPQTTADFTWTVPGSKVITVTAINQGGQVSSQPHMIQISTPWYVYLPLVVRAIPTCLGNVLTNGDFELGHTGWYTYTNGFWWKQHDLIGSAAQGYESYQGHYAARLGGYEGVWDIITQTVVIPAQGRLTYWWKGWTYVTRPRPDTFDVALLSQNGTQIALLAHHDDLDVLSVWKQDVVDVTAYAGQALILRFSSRNNNYNSAWFNLDTICLSSVSSR